MHQDTLVHSRIKSSSRRLITVRRRYTYDQWSTRSPRHSRRHLPRGGRKYSSQYSPRIRGIQQSYAGHLSVSQCYLIHYEQHQNEVEVYQIECWWPDVYRMNSGSSPFIGSTGQTLPAVFTSCFRSKSRPSCMVIFPPVWRCTKTLWTSGQLNNAWSTRSFSLIIFPPKIIKSIWY